MTENESKAWAAFLNDVRTDNGNLKNFVITKTYSFRYTGKCTDDVCPIITDKNQINDFKNKIKYRR